MKFKIGDKVRFAKTGIIYRITDTPECTKMKTCNGDWISAYIYCECVSYGTYVRERTDMEEQFELITENK